MKKPTIDREENVGHYTLENCRFIEKSENSAKDKRKPVLQFDLNGNFIREWNSVREAGRQLKIASSHISSCCSGKYGYKTAHNFKWRFKEDENVK